MEEKCKNCGYCQKYRKEPSFINLDSYIEEVFLNKCNANSKCSMLLLEWVDSKCIYTKYTNLSRSDYGNYSKHDFSHSVAILNALTSVLGKKKIEALGATDLWLILHCAYGHDIGMPYSYSQMLEFWDSIKKDEIFKTFFLECMDSEDLDLRNAALYISKVSDELNVHLTDQNEDKDSNLEFDTNFPALIYRYTSFLTSEFVRRYHAQRSKELMEACNIYRNSGCSQIEPRYYKLIAKICMLHTAPFEEVLKLHKHERDVETGNCHPRFAASMLRLGDLLDIDNNRFDLIDLQHYGALPQKSQIHKKKHEAIEHIKYTEREIEIVARSDDENVCQAANDWFEMLKDEVRNIVFNWTDIAPECLGGCTLSEPKTTVYLNEQQFYRVRDCEFKVDKETLIDLVIGRNLYKAKFDFLKEYIQNAMDAVKMQFWMDTQDGNLDFFIKNEEKMRQKKRRELLPFEFDPIVFRQYALDIVCEFVEKENPKSLEKNEVVRIEIHDKGIGIDRECISAISNIGSGWSRRKKYARYLDDMPKWLRPTGGFGIGMQSGFMITNEIQIETRCEGDPQGRKIALFSNKRNGRIEEREYPVRHNGTKVIVDVPYKWFMDSENYKEYPELTFEPKDVDFFDSGRMMRYITEFICKYVKIISNNPVFPINIRQRDCTPEIINGFCLLGMDGGIHLIWEDDNYQIYKYKETEKILIWEKHKGILCRIQPNNSITEPGWMRWYFKGMRVWVDEPKDSTKHPLYEFVGNFDIDIMGIPVKECLTVDRNRFMNDFDYNVIAKDFAVVYLRYLAAKGEIYHEENAGNSFLNCIAAYKYVKEEEYRGNIRDCLDSDVGGQWLDFMKQSDMQLFKFKNGNMEDQIPDTLFGLCKELWFEDSLWWIDHLDKTDTDLIKPCSHIISDYKCIWNVTGTDAGKRVGKLLKTLFEDSCEEERDDEYRLFHYQRPTYEENNSTEDKKEIFRILPGKRQIFFSVQFYPKLYVGKVPFDMEDKATLDKKKKKNMILSPIPALYADQDVVLNLKGKDEPEEKYFSMITENRMYDQLLDWVYEHQIVPGKYTREEIAKEYRELIQYIYDTSFKPRISGNI